MGTDHSETVVEEQFPVGGSPELSLGTVSGRVSIVPSNEPVIRVHARKYGRPHAVDNTRIEFSRQGDAVTVRTRAVSRGILGGNTVSAVDFDVSVPQGCLVQVDTVSAGIDIRGIGGSVDVHTVSGRISLDAASESSSITTVSGDVVGRHVQGTLRLTSVSGDARITDSSFSEFEVESVSGRVELETRALLRRAISRLDGEWRSNAAPSRRHAYHRAPVVGKRSNQFRPAGHDRQAWLRQVASNDQRRRDRPSPQFSEWQCDHRAARRAGACLMCRSSAGTLAANKENFDAIEPKPG